MLIYFLYIRETFLIILIYSSLKTYVLIIFVCYKYSLLLNLYS